jgi:hypothetical protein
MSICWPDAGTRQLQESLADAGFSFADWWFREYALFHGESLQRALDSFRAAGDARAKRELALGHLGPLEDQFAPAFLAFNNSIRPKSEATKGPINAISTMRREEAERFGIPESISFPRQKDFLNFAVTAAEARGFQTTKLKRESSGPVMNKGLSGGYRLIFYFTSPRSWSDWGAHQTFCEVLPADATERVAASNVDSLVPGFGISYRTYKGWRECALSGLAIAQLYRSFADALTT